MKMKLVVCAGRIPEGSTVTKKHGTYTHVLMNKVRIYSEGSKTPQVIDGEGVRYLISQTGSISGVSNLTELVWHVEEEDLLRWLQSRDDGVPQ